MDEDLKTALKLFFSSKTRFTRRKFAFVLPSFLSFALHPGDIRNVFSQMYLASICNVTYLLVTCTESYMVVGIQLI